MNILDTNSKDLYPSTFDGLLKLVDRLRSPNGCPWDRQQTRETFRNHFLEEAYELIDALDSGDSESICAESGDVLLHIAFQIQLARESGSFSGKQVLENVISKLINRHPHVFQNVNLKDEAHLLRNWDEIKKFRREIGFVLALGFLGMVNILFPNNRIALDFIFTLAHCDGALISV